jgi:hypothetical protein
VLRLAAALGAPTRRRVGLKIELKERRRAGAKKKRRQVAALQNRFMESAPPPLPESITPRLEAVTIFSVLILHRVR